VFRKKLQKNYIILKGKKKEDFYIDKIIEGGCGGIKKGGGDESFNLPKIDPAKKRFYRKEQDKEG